MKASPNPSYPRLVGQRWARWFRTRLHLDDRLEEGEGDLAKMYVYWYRKVGKTKATWKYLLNVVSALPPFVRRREQKQDVYQSLTTTDMLRNYLKIAWRSLAKNKVYSLINIGGLALGMTVAMLIGLLVHDELTFNKYHKNYDRIAQVMRTISADGQVFTDSYLPYPLADVLRKNYGDYFKHVVMAWPAADYIISGVDRTVSRLGAFIEPDAPQMFSLKMVQGNWNSLQNPNSIILSASLADALFGQEKVVGKQLKINSQIDVLVTGVYQDLPHSSTFHEVKFFSSFGGYASANPWIKEQGWTNNTIQLYAELQPNLVVDQVSS